MRQVIYIELPYCLERLGANETMLRLCKNFPFILRKIIGTNYYQLITTPHTIWHYHQVTSTRGVMTNVTAMSHAHARTHAHTRRRRRTHTHTHTHAHARARARTHARATYQSVRKC